MRTSNSPDTQKHNQTSSTAQILAAVNEATQKQPPSQSNVVSKSRGFVVKYINNKIDTEQQ